MLITWRELRMLDPNNEFQIDTEKRLIVQVGTNNCFSINSFLNRLASPQTVDSILTARLADIKAESAYVDNAIEERGISEADKG